MNDTLIVAFAFIIGASWGSFLYTFIIRYTNGMYTNNPCHALTYPSHCPHCHKKIKPVYLIPVIGYCLTKGCCAYCKKPVSLRYPLSELFCGIVAVIAVLQFPLAIAPVLFVAFTTSVSIAIIDTITMEIPDLLVLIILIAGIIITAIEGEVVSHIEGAALMLVVFILPLVIKKGGFGGGDIKYAVAIGFFLGFSETIVALEIALVSGALFGILFAVIKTKTLKAKIPFAPFLTLGFIVALLYGRDIMLLYYYYI